MIFLPPVSQFIHQDASKSNKDSVEIQENLIKWPHCRKPITYRNSKLPKMALNTCYILTLALSPAAPLSIFHIMDSAPDISDFLQSLTLILPHISVLAFSPQHPLSRNFLTKLIPGGECEFLSLPTAVLWEGRLFPPVYPIIPSLNTHHKFCTCYLFNEHGARLYDEHFKYIISLNPQHNPKNVAVIIRLHIPEEITIFRDVK